MPHYESGTHRLWSLLEGMPSALRRVDLWLAQDLKPCPGTGDGWQYHPVPTLVSCLSGVVRTLGGPAGRLDLQAGETLVIGPGVWHAHVAVRHNSVSYRQGFVGTYSDLTLFDQRRKMMGKVPIQPCRQLMDRLVALGTGVAMAEARKHACTDVFRHLLTETIDPLPPPHPAIQSLVDLLWARYFERITAADLVAASGLGRSQAYALFGAYFGESIKQALLRMRLELAQGLLREGFRVSVIAPHCGFSSRSDLSRCFQRRFGLPPREERARSRRTSTAVGSATTDG